MAITIKPEIENIGCFEVPENYDYYMSKESYNIGEYTIYTQNWKRNTVYQKGEYVKYENCLYKSIINNNLNKVPDVLSSSTSWEKWELSSASTFLWTNGNDIYYEKMYVCNESFEILEWDVSEDYYYGSIVKHNDVYYKCNSTANVVRGEEPSDSSSVWVLIGTAQDTWNPLSWDEVSPIKFRYVVDGLSNTADSKIYSKISCEESGTLKMVFEQDSFKTDEIGIITLSREKLKTLKNGKSYRICLCCLSSTVGRPDEFVSDWSDWSFFNTFDTSVLEFNGEFDIKGDNYYKLTSGSITPSVRYVGVNNKTHIPSITSYKFNLYDDGGHLINTSGIKYVTSKTDVLNLSYKFDNFSNDSSLTYYIQVEAYSDDTLRENGTGIVVKSKKLKIKPQSSNNGGVGLSIEPINDGTGCVDYKTSMVVIVPKELITKDNKEGLFNEYKYYTYGENEIPLFDEDVVYSVGQLVVYNGQIYQCRQQHTGIWNSNDFLKYDRDPKTFYIDLLNKSEGGIPYIATYNKGWETSKDFTFSIYVRSIVLGENLITISNQYDTNNPKMVLSTIVTDEGKCRFKLLVDGILSDTVIYTEEFNPTPSTEGFEKVYTIWIYRTDECLYDLVVNINEEDARRDTV